MQGKLRNLFDDVISKGDLLVGWIITFLRMVNNVSGTSFGGLEELKMEKAIWEIAVIFG